MKIAMLTSFFFPHRGGTEKYVLDLSKALIALGHEVTVFTHTKGEEINYSGIEVVRLQSLWIPYQPIVTRRIKNQLDDFDIVHSHVPPYFFNQTVRIPYGVPHIVTYHCDVLIPDSIKGVKIPRLLARSLDKFFQKKAVRQLKKSSHIIATSKDYADSSGVLKQLLYTEVPIGVHLDEHKTLSKCEPFDFVFVGRLATSKGVDILLKAASMLATEHTSFTLRIIGGGEEMNGLKKKASELNLNDYVYFDGRVSDEKLAESLSAARSLILPSISRLEAFGIVQLEAFCFGTPVIVSDLPGVRGLVNNSGGGWIVEPCDYKSLAKAMGEVLTDKKEAINKGKKGQLTRVKRG